MLGLLAVAGAGCGVLGARGGVSAHTIAHAPFTFRIVPLALACSSCWRGRVSSGPAQGQCDRERRSGDRRRPAAPRAERRPLSLARRVEAPPVQRVEAMHRSVEAKSLAVAGDDADGLAVHLDDIGVGLVALPARRLATRSCPGRAAAMRSTEAGGCGWVEVRSDMS